MKLCDETITVFNRILDDEGYDAYIPTVIRGASWFCEVASAVTDTGLNAADKYTIRIPEDADFGGKSYASPAEYKESEGSFTLRNGDVIVKGEVTDMDLTPAKLQKAFGQIVTILGVTDNRRARNARHWKVVGR